MKKIILVAFIQAAALMALTAQAQTVSSNTNTINSPGNLLDTLFDRLGNKYSLADIQINTTNSYTVNGKSYSTLVNPQPCGYFNLYFETGCGMENNGTNALHTQRLAVLCQLMTDLSAFINSPLPPGQFVNIWVRDIANMGGGGNALGLASGFYAMPPSSPKGGITDNMVWKTIISGVDGYTNVAPPLIVTGNTGGFYHAAIAFNFNFNWGLSLNTCSPPGAFDLYSVGLHEMTHALGFASLINFNGSSRFSNPFDFYYSRYDLFLRTSNSQTPGNTSLLTNTGACGGLYDYIFNPAVNTSLLGNNCTGGSSNNTNCPDALFYSGGVNVPVYTPNNPNCYEPGSSLSHFEDQCYPTGTPFGNDLYFVMSNANGAGPAFCKRFLKSEERAVLCDLGYNVNNSYGVVGMPSFFNYPGAACNPDAVVGVNDGVTGGSYQYVTTYGSAGITINNFLANDYSSLSAVTSGTCYEIISGGGSITGAGATSFNYVPSVAGPGETVLVRYVPVDAIGTEGSITYIFIRVNGTCPATPCNYLNNGDFEAPSPKCGEIPGQPVISCWSSLYGTPDLYIRNCANGGGFSDYDASCVSQAAPIQYNLGTSTFNSVPPINSHPGPPLTNNQTVGLACRVQNWGGKWHESMQTTMTTPLVAGQQYNVSFWVTSMNSNFVNSGTALVPNIPIEIRSNPGTLVSSTAFGLSYPATTTFLAGTVIPNDFQWHYMTLNFTATTNDNVFIFGFPDNFLISPNWPNCTYAYIMVDDIRLLPAGVAGSFNLPNSTLCINQVISDLSLYATPSGGTFSGPGVQLNAGIYSFDPNIAGSGIHILSYSYTDMNGCSQLVHTQVTVVNTSLTLTVPNSQNCPGSCTQVTATSNTGTNFQWSDGTTLATHLNCVPTSGVSVSYMVTVTNSQGCSATATSIASPLNCNCTGIPLNISAGIINGGGPYALNASVTLPSNFNLTNAVVAIAPNVKITVPNGVTFDIVNSHLYACNDMWDSIIVQQGGKMRTKSNSLIEDAKTAINVTSTFATQPVLDIDQTIFNKNGNAITIANYQFNQPIYPFIIRRSVFTSRNLWTSANTWPSVANLVATSPPPPPSPYIGPYLVGRNYASANLKAPFNIAPQVAGVGIRLISVGPATTGAIGGYVNNEITIGSSGNGMLNVFDNLHYGIAANNSNFLSVNNSFQNMIAVIFKGTVSYGYGIFGVAGENHSARVVAANNKINKFYECRRGVDLNGYTEVYVDNSYFISDRITPVPGQITSTPTGEIAINWRSNRSTKIEVNDNIIYNHFVGIGLQQGFSTLGGTQVQTQGPINIENNLIQANLGNGNPTTQSIGTGIVCNNLLTCLPGPNCQVTTTGPVTITNNQIIRAFRGIQANNWYVQTSTIFQNSITGMRQEPNSMFNQVTQQWGIFSANCTGGIINNNSITGTAITKDPQWKGIYVIQSTSREVRCNYTATVPRGIVFEGQNTGTIFWDNTMNSCKYGYVLQNNGVIGPQAPATQPVTSDNTWSTYTAGNTYKTLADVSDARNSPLTIRNPTIYHPSGIFNLAIGAAFDYNATLPNALNIISSTGNRSCNIGSQFQFHPGPPDKRVVMEEIVQDQIPYIIYPSESSIHNKREVFRAIQQDNNLMNGSPVLQNFYNTNQNTAHGKFSETESNLLSENMTAGQISLASITPSNEVEFRTKQFYTLYAKAKTNTLNASDSLILDTLASLCIAQFGTMVHQARVLYDFIYDNFHLYNENCPGLGNNNKTLQVLTSTTAKEYSFGLFPNPAKDELFIHLPEGEKTFSVSIYDINGRMVYEATTECENSLSKLNLDLENGVYMVNMKTENFSEAQKLIITK